MISPYVVPGLKSKIQNLKRIVQIEDIITSVCVYFKTNFDTIKRKDRSHKAVLMRMIICYLLRKHTTLTLKQIAEQLNPAITDHTTVMHGIAFVEGQMSLKHENSIKIVLNEIYI
jgi:chromosomal replication initiation ATPase DnaA